MSNQVCPLCASPKHMRRSKALYNVPVCRKCYYRFANRRQMAYIADWLVFTAVVFCLTSALVVVLKVLRISDEATDVILMVLGWVGFPLVFFLKDGFAGHSFGKLISGVQVVDRRSSEPIGFSKSFKRNLVLVIPFVPLIVAFLLQKGYRWGDGWAETKVIWKKYARNPVFTGGMNCEQCQYDLKGNTSGICPECGAPIHNARRSPMQVLEPVPTS